MNIVEDVRIEKMMKRRYAGISKTFYRGYSELAAEDFFCVANEDVNKMNDADKAKRKNFISRLVVLLILISILSSRKAGF